MSKYLVVVESPTKAKTISKFLGKNYRVMSSMGHIRDLPKSKLGIDVENGFAPHYITIRGKGELLKELKKSAKGMDKIYYAADPDREGEAIAWHLSQYLEGDKGEAPCRIEFNEITKDAIQSAVKHPRSINMDRVLAQQSRRILDRLVGYKLSPLLWKKVRKGLSAGRVQSVAVRLICERQQEIDDFKPEEYWSLDADFSHEAEQFAAKLAKIKGKKAEIGDREAMDAVLKGLEGASYQVISVQKKERKKNPPAAFTTSGLQQEANQKLGFTAKRTMQLAQQLYEGISLGAGNIGLITYMRTDSIRVNSHAQDEARDFIAGKYGAPFVPEKPPAYKQKSGNNHIQNAHEAIRPTSVLRDPQTVKEHLTQPQFKLYRLIWERFVASQMAPAVTMNTTYDIEANDYLFRANGSIITFPGYLKVYRTDVAENELPDIAEGAMVGLVALKPEQHFTQPPPAYTEATLIKTLEKLGIGRPSTYVTIIETVVARGYVIRREKTFRPTELGKIVNDLLLEHFPNILNVEFTANLEDELDKVEEGAMPWDKVLEDFYGPFAESLARAEEIIGEIELTDEESDVVCEFCGRKMVYKMGRFGRFLACPGYPECRNVKSVDKDGNVEEKIIEESDVVCEHCGRKMVVKKGRYGKFLACPGYPECKNIKSIDVEIGVNCHKCGAPLVKKRTKAGRVFYGCKNYPQCTVNYWNLPIPELCPECGQHLVEKMDKKKGKTVFCENKECPAYPSSAKGKGRKKADTDEAAV